MRKWLSLVVLLAVLSLPLVALAQDAPPTIAEIVAGDENFSTLLEAVNAAGLAETLGGEGELTVFAPTNAAFEALPPGMLDGLMSSPPSVEAVVKYHVLEGVYSSADLATAGSLPTLLGAPLSFSAGDDGSVVINGTVKVVTADIEASNGVVHVIDAVLVPERPGSSAGAPETTEPEGGNTIVDVVSGNEELAFLTTALGLSEVAMIDLSVPMDAVEYTLFAPKDAAFTALDDATRNAAIADPKLLTSILLYHMVPVKFLTTDIQLALAQSANEMEVETALPGAMVKLSMDDAGNLRVNDIQVVATNFEASNGVVHILNGVLMPPADAILTQEEYDALVAAARTAASSAMGAEGSDHAAMPEGPALDPNWDAVAGGFGMAELNTADDFFQTVIDPFAEGEAAELYGIEIINWTADYQYTGFIVQQFLPAEVLIWMAEQDPTVWDNISDSVLKALPAAELAKLPADIQARVQ